MRYVYSEQSEGFEPGVRYSNPRFFERLREGTTEVHIVGDWPAVVAACDAAGIPCTIEGVDPAEPTKTVAAPEPAATTQASPADGPDIRKGPRGLWFAYDEGKTISPGYATEDEARAALTAA